MNINFDEILLELSYRVGIVDLTKEGHVNELVSILRESGVSDANEFAQKARVYFSYLKESQPKLKEKTSSNPLTDLDTVMQKMVTYKDANGKDHEIQVASALKYKNAKDPGQKGAYAQALQLLKKAGATDDELGIDTKSKKEIPKANITTTGAEKKADVKSKEPEEVKLDGSLGDVLGRFEDNRNNKTSIDNVNQALKSVNQTLTKFSKDKKNPNAKEHKQVADLLTNLFNGKKLSSSEQKLVSRYIRVAEPTDANPNACKIYVARQPDNFSSQGPTKRERIYVGAKDKSTPVIGAFRKWAEKNGIPVLATSTFGGKKTTANQTYTNPEGKTRVLKNAATVKESGGKVQSVKIGNLDIVRMDPAKAKTPYEAKLIAKNNRIMEEYAEKIKANDMDFIDMDKGVIPDSPKNRVTVIQSAIGGMADNLTKLADKASVNDENTRNLINQLSRYSKLDPNKDPQKWLAGFENLLSKIANHDGEPSLKEAWANYAEIFVAIREMHDNGKGTENGKCALLPQSTTLETVDVITVSNGKGDNRIVTLDGRSVKKGVGGASALTSKCKKSTYKNDSKGNIKKGVIELSESHNKPYELSIDEPLSKHKTLQLAYQKYLKEKAKQLNVDTNFISQLEKDTKTKGGRGYGKIESAYKNIMLERKKAGLDVSGDTMNKIKMRLQSYYMYSVLAHESYNSNVDVQDFANDSVLSQKEDRGGAALARAGKIAIDRSDGINILAYPSPEFNIGFTLEGKSKNPGSGRFHNQEKRKA